MEKMKMESVDIIAQNVEKIGELFPNCITETIDENVGSMRSRPSSRARGMLVFSFLAQP